MKNLKIIVDNGQRDSAVPKQLETKEVQVEYANLRAGSYLITNDVAIQRMTSKDFGRLTSEKALFRHLLDFKKSYAEPILLIEGNSLLQNRLASSGAIRGAISYVSCLNRIPIVQTSSESESAEMLFIMANQTQFGLGFEVSAPESSGAAAALPKPKTPKEIRAHIVQTLPDVGPAMADAVIKMFGNLRTLFSATAADLTKISGLGPKKAQKIIEAIEYDNDDKNKR